MRSLLLLVFGALVACMASTTLAPPVTCPAIDVTQQNGECDLVATQKCSDNSFYEINCGDDSTCTCIQNGNLFGQPVLASDMTVGYCATLDASKLNQISVLCGLNLNPPQ